MAREILLVEDEPAIAANTTEALRRSSYEVRHFSCAQGVIESCQQRQPDLAIIDIGLGDDSEAGFGLCRELRASNALLPIVFLTARDSEIDIVSGLRLGADDYLTKNISHAHLLARIVALLRRMDAIRAGGEQESCLRRGDLEINQDRMTASWQRQPLDLTVTEFWILRCLARHPGHVKSRQQLMDAANVVLDDNTITSHIKRLRRKFQQLDQGFDALQTAYGMGYRWLDPS